MTDNTRKNLGLGLFILLVLWGGYSALVYMGVPVHGSALLSDQLYANITPAECAPGANLCYLQRGIQALLPVVFYTLERAAPFLGYAIIFALAYAGYVLWRGSRNGSAIISFTWKPWKVLGLMIASVWLINLCFSLGTVDGRSVRMYPEPTKDTYPTISAQALSTLQEEFGSLQSQGCLNPTDQQYESGARVYTFSEFCVQKAFFARVVPQMLFVLLLILEFLVLGRGILTLLKWRPRTLLLETVFSGAMGAGALIAVLWLAAVAHVYTTAVGWVIMAAILAGGYTQTLYWLKTLLTHEWEDERPWYDMRLLLSWLLITYIALNFLEVVRPFPIGWDDLGSYLNRPRLLVSYGFFIPTMSPFDWGYLTSLGFLLFGYDSAFGSTAAMMVNWTAGLMAVAGIWAMAKTFLGEREGVLSALLYYSLPLVGHFSFADMKIDNAVFFFGTMATLAVFLCFFGRHEEPLHQHERKMLLLTGGIFAGMALAVKITAVMMLFPLLGVVIGALAGWEAFAGIFALAFAVFGYKNLVSISDLAQRIYGDTAPQWLNSVFAGVCALIGLTCLGYAAFRARAHGKMHAILTLTFLLGVSISVLPWVIHDNITYGNVIPKLELSAKNTLTPSINIYEALPAELAVNKNNPACTPTGAKEELDRYWGYGKGWSHYVTLPWRTVMNIDSAGYYVTTIPALLLFPLLLLLGYFWTEKGRWARWLFVSTGFILFEWMMLANGIPWYGISVFLGLCIGLELLVKEAPSRGPRITAAILIGLSLVTAFGHRLWQLETQRNIFEYSMGKISADSLREITIPYYDDIARQTVERSETIKDRPYLYRIGTFIAYFIPKNLQVIGITDHQLDVFNCLYQERDAALTTKRLKALGFNSFVFDTNTSTIESDPNGSLHQKVNAFVQYVNNPASGVQVVISDTNAGIGYILIP